MDELDGVQEARASGPVITQSAFDALWPTIQSRLIAALMRSGSSREDAEDVVQEVALKLMRAQLSSHDVDDVLPWCLRVARNAMIDLHRRHRPLQAWSDAFDELPAVGHDTAHIVEQRDRLDRVLRCIPQMRAADLEAVLSPRVDGRDRKEAVKHNVRRLRARERLLQMVGAVTAVLGLSRQHPAAPVGVVLASAASLLVLLHGGVGMIPWSAHQQVTAGAAVAPAVARPAATDSDVPARHDVGVGSRSAPGDPVAAPQEARRPYALDIRTPTEQTLVRVVMRPRAAHEERVVACAFDVPLAGQLCVQRPEPPSSAVVPAASVASPSLAQQDVRP